MINILTENHINHDQIHQSKNNWLGAIFFSPIDSHTKHCTENHIFFFRTSCKDGLSKKIAPGYDLSCIIGKDDIYFCRKYDLSRQTENERWSFLKNTRKSDIFFKPSEKMGLPKRAAPAHDLSCTTWKNDTFFRKHDLFCLGRK